MYPEIRALVWGRSIRRTVYGIVDAYLRLNAERLKEEVDNANENSAEHILKVINAELRINDSTPIGAILFYPGMLPVPGFDIAPTETFEVAGVRFLVRNNFNAIDLAALSHHVLTHHGIMLCRLEMREANWPDAIKAFKACEAYPSNARPNIVVDDERPGRWSVKIVQPHNWIVHPADRP